MATTEQGESAISELHKDCTGAYGWGSPTTYATYIRASYFKDGGGPNQWPPAKRGVKLVKVGEFCTQCKQMVRHYSFTLPKD